MMGLGNSKTRENLDKAFSGESQARNKYTYFAEVAESEWYYQIAEIFSVTAENEKMHAKLWLAELGRFCLAKVAYPGGCEIGARPIDQHLKAFEALGVNVVCDDDTKSVIISTGKNGLCGDSVVSVGETIKAVLAAVKVSWTTVIDNTAREPHVVDLANFLNAAGADIEMVTVE